MNTTFEDDRFGILPGYEEQLKLRFMMPPVELIRVPTAVPRTIKDGVRIAASAVWNDPSAAVNRLRASIEILLDEQGVPLMRSLHRRIESLAITTPDIAKLLEAIKWVGNAGSHGFQDVKVADVIEIADYLEHVLIHFYGVPELVRRASLTSAAHRNQSKNP